MEVFDFGLRLQELRRNKGLTQGRAAQRLGINRATISAYERNLKTPGTEILVKIAYLYGASLDYIMGLEKTEMLPLSDFSSDERRLAVRMVDFLREIKELCRSDRKKSK